MLAGGVYTWTEYLELLCMSKAWTHYESSWIGGINNFEINRVKKSENAENSNK